MPGVLPCKIGRTLSTTVYWGIGPNASNVHNIVAYFPAIGKRFGPGYKSGLFNVSDHYSLIINNVRIEDEGNYFCEVFDDELGRPVLNQTKLHVVGE